MTENALSILIIFSVQLQQTEISERKLFIFHLGMPLVGIILYTLQIVCCFNLKILFNKQDTVQLCARKYVNKGKRSTMTRQHRETWQHRNAMNEQFMFNITLTV